MSLREDAQRAYADYCAHQERARAQLLAARVEEVRDYLKSRLDRLDINATSIATLVKPDGAISAYAEVEGINFRSSGGNFVHAELRCPSGDRCAITHGICIDHNTRRDDFLRELGAMLSGPCFTRERA